MNAPATEAELLDRVAALRHRTLASIAEALGAAVPRDLRRDKGWVGTLLEAALGATGGPNAERDFPHLGIELKTIPLDARGRPKESTFVCVAPLGPESLLPWEETWLKAKLAKVLWVPITGDGPPGERVVGQAKLWMPSPEEDALLAADWAELGALLGLGHFDEIDASYGELIQLRPKAASSHSHAWALDAEAQWVQVNPLGFYLRASFTRRLLATP